MKNRDTGKSWGFAFVTIKDPDEMVKNAILSQKH